MQGLKVALSAKVAQVSDTPALNRVCDVCGDVLAGSGQQSVQLIDK